MLRFDDRLGALDVTLFESIYSETTSEDKRSLLALQVACRREVESFNWLEIGSHLGARFRRLCATHGAHISSIDPRPTEQLPDERQRQTSYPDNSTNECSNCSRAFPGQDSASCGPTRPARKPSTRHLRPASRLLVDGEHTDEACERDADFCRRALRIQG